MLHIYSQFIFWNDNNLCKVVLELHANVNVAFNVLFNIFYVYMSKVLFYIVHGVNGFLWDNVYFSIHWLQFVIKSNFIKVGKITTCVIFRPFPKIFNHWMIDITKNKRFYLFLFWVLFLYIAIIYILEARWPSCKDGGKILDVLKLVVGSNPQ